MQEQGNKNNKNVKPNNSVYIYISAQGNIGMGVDGNLLSVGDVMRPSTNNKGED